MAPNSRIFLTRHAQAEHNVDQDYSSTITCQWQNLQRQTNPHFQYPMPH